MYGPAVGGGKGWYAVVHSITPPHHPDLCEAAAGGQGLGQGFGQGSSHAGKKQPWHS